MGWENRDYNRGGTGDYFANPAALLSYSVPFGTWLGARVRLHFWLLLTIVFMYIGAAHGLSPIIVTAGVAILVVSLLLHEFGHRVVGSWVGGRHDEFMLWPSGGMIPPTAPPYPGPYFATHVGGIAVNLLVCLVTGAAMWFRWDHVPMPSLNPLAALSVGGAIEVYANIGFTLLAIAFLVNAGLVITNLLPFEWFNGGYLFEAILWPWTGRYQAINVTCIVGMCVAVPFFLLSLYGTDFLGMIIWALLFASAFSRRRQLVAGGGSGELDEAIAYSAQTREDSPRRSKARSYWGSKKALKDARDERKTQEQIDAILAKVHEKGMQSLTWLERRTLQRATEQQRKRERSLRR